MKFWLLPVGVVFIMLVSGCGDQKYSKPEACQIPSTIVADVLGSDSFTVSDSDDRLPLDADAPAKSGEGTGNYRCLVYSDGERALTLAVTFIFDEVLARQQQQIEGSSHEFRHAGGIGTVLRPNTTDLEGYWACGNVGVKVLGTTVEPWTEKAGVELVKSLADLAGCWELSK